ncbi:MAG: chemotaxis protein CheA [Desulfopila sp.]
MEFDDEEILQGFIEESLEHLADIENDLLSIEEHGVNIDEELVNKVFRAAHSIKGSAGFMGLTGIQELSHAIENVLGLIRGRKLIPDSEIIHVLLLAADQLQEMINDIQSSNDVDISAHLQPLHAIFTGTFQPAVTDVRPLEPEAESLTDQKEPPPGRQAEQALTAMQPPPFTTEVPEVDHRVATENIAPTTPAEQRSTSAMPTGNGASKTETSIRVNLSLLDTLMTLAGELVLSRNQLLKTIGSNDSRSTEAVSQHIDLITSELQEAIMLTRMQPIGNVFNKFPRIVRDLAKELNKTIELTIVGKDVELDRTIIETINDPLTHLIRNAVDHGIEPPQQRRLQGKPATGKVTLKAYHEAGQVVIEIADDGKGIDGEALAASAVRRGLLSLEQARVMSEKEKVNLIFLPGFSTAARVTNVSGRGVGMDVVKTNLDQLGGHVEILSELGLGTTISIKLPLTLAIIPCQIIMTGGERYAIPQVNLEELLRISAAQVKERIERVGDAQVVRLRDTLLPLVRLADIIGLERHYQDEQGEPGARDRRQRIADRRSRSSPPAGTDPSSADATDKPLICRAEVDRRSATASALNIVVVSTGSMKYGLIVDRLLDSEEVVIKPLGRFLQRCKEYAGTTIMGDGRIALILDVANLARMANLTSLDNSDRAVEISRARENATRASQGRQALLIFHSSASEQFAVPLAQVERIEKIKSSEIKILGGRRVTRYRDGSLPLVRIDDVAVAEPLAEVDNLVVIVFNLGHRLVGLLATGPVDTMEITAEIDDVTLKQPGISGSLLIGSTTTMLVNIAELVQGVFPDWWSQSTALPGAIASASHAPVLLSTDDTGPYSAEIRGYMTGGEYELIPHEKELTSWNLLEQERPLPMMLIDLAGPEGIVRHDDETDSSPSRSAGVPAIALAPVAGNHDDRRHRSNAETDSAAEPDRRRLPAKEDRLYRRHS